MLGAGSWHCPSLCPKLRVTPGLGSWSPPVSLSLSQFLTKFNGTMQLHYLKSHNTCWYDSFITVNLYIYLLIKEVILGDTSSLLGNNCPMLYILYMLYKQSKICKSKCLVDSAARRLGSGRAPSWATMARAQGSQQGHHPAGLGQVWGRMWPRCFSPHQGERGRLWERPH